MAAGSCEATGAAGSFWEPYGDNAANGHFGVKSLLGTVKWALALVLLHAETAHGLNVQRIPANSRRPAAFGYH